MRTIYLNAPIQNGNFSPDVSPGKIVPLLVAEWSRRHSGEDSDRVDLWNNIVAANTEGLAEASRRLEAKYTSKLFTQLGEFGVRRIISDNNAEFIEWGTGLVDELIADGTLDIQERDVIACRRCDSVIALSDLETARLCVQCATDSMRSVKRQVLISHVDEAAIGKANHATDGLVSTLYPHHESVVSKRRSGGIPLDKIGFPDQYVDPKVSVGLLALYAAEQLNGDRVELVASRTTCAHNLPQLYAFLGDHSDDLPDLKMKPIAKAPTGYVTYLRDEGIVPELDYYDILANVLPPYLLSMKQDMTPKTAERIIFGHRQK